MSKITAYAALASPLADDLLIAVDVHDTTMAATGTDKKVTAAALLAGAAGVFNVKASGAAGDGATDDTAAFGSARDAAGTGGTALVPPGTYILSALALNVAGQQWVVMPGATLKLKAATTDHLLSISASGITITGGGTLDGNFANQTASSSRVFIAITSDHITLDGVIIQNANGYAIQAFGAVTHLAIRDCRFTSCYNMAALIQSDGTVDITDITVTGNTVENNDPAMAGGAGGFFIQGSGSFLARRVIVSENQISCYPVGNGEPGFADNSAAVNIGPAQTVTVASNVIRGSQFAVSLGQVTDGTVSANAVSDYTILALEAGQGCSRVTFTGNTVLDTNPRHAAGYDSQRCLAVEGASGTATDHVAVTGNIFHHSTPSGFQACIFTHFVTYVTFSGNTVRRNTSSSGDLLDINYVQAAVTGNIFDGGGDNATCIFVSTDAGATQDISITGNQFLNYGGGAGIVYGGAANLDYAVISGNIFHPGAGGDGMYPGGTGALGSNTEVLGNIGGPISSTSIAVLTPAFANGTAAQLSDKNRDYMVYLAVTTAGTATTVAIGPTSAPANTILPSSAVTAGQLISFRLPAGWFAKWAGTTTAIATQTAIGC